MFAFDPGTARSCKTQNRSSARAAKSAPTTFSPSAPRSQALVDCGGPVNARTSPPRRPYCDRTSRSRFCRRLAPSLLADAPATPSIGANGSSENDVGSSVPAEASSVSPHGKQRVVSASASDQACAPVSRTAPQREHESGDDMCMRSTRTQSAQQPEFLSYTSGTITVAPNAIPSAKHPVAATSAGRQRRASARTPAK